MAAEVGGSERGAHDSMHHTVTLRVVRECIRKPGGNRPVVGCCVRVEGGRIAEGGDDHAGGLRAAGEIIKFLGDGDDCVPVHKAISRAAFGREEKSATNAMTAPSTCEGDMTERICLWAAQEN